MADKKRKLSDKELMKLADEAIAKIRTDTKNVGSKAATKDPDLAKADEMLAKIKQDTANIDKTGPSVGMVQNVAPQRSAWSASPPPERYEPRAMEERAPRQEPRVISIPPVEIRSERGDYRNEIDPYGPAKTVRGWGERAGDYVSSKFPGLKPRLEGKMEELDAENGPRWRMHNDSIRFMEEHPGVYGMLNEWRHKRDLQDTNERLRDIRKIREGAPIDGGEL